MFSAVYFALSGNTCKWHTSIAQARLVPIIKSTVSLLLDPDGHSDMRIELVSRDYMDCYFRRTTKASPNMDRDNDGIGVGGQAGQEAQEGVGT
jgi:hypothetical protein